MKPGKMTNAVRLLTSAGYPVETVTFTIGEEHLSASELAALLGEDVRMVFKTIVLQGDRTGVIVCVAPGDSEIDLKKAAKVSGNKKVEPLPLKMLQSTTGYIRGGCSPVGMKKRYPTFFHQSCLQFDFIFVSAGARNMQMKVHPADIVAYTGATVADITIGGNDE